MNKIPAHFLYRPWPPSLNHLTLFAGLIVLSHLACSGPSNTTWDTETGSDAYGNIYGDTDADTDADTDIDTDADGETNTDQVAPLPPVVLPTDISYEFPGIIADDRSPWPVYPHPRGTGDCNKISSIVIGRQRTTVGPGIQLSVALRNATGYPLIGSRYENCVGMRNGAGETLGPAITSASATGALTLILAQPGKTAEENKKIAYAANQLFRSRPHGERIAFFRWGATVQQVVSFTEFRDTFSDGVTQRFPIAGSTTANINTAIDEAADALSDVADDSHLWTRNLVVLAPNLDSSHVIPSPNDINVLWMIKDIEGTAAFNLLEAEVDSLSDAMAAVSTRLNEYNRAGFVTMGLCGSGGSEVASVLVEETGLKWPITLKAAKDEEMTGSCTPTVVANYTYNDTPVIELSVDGAAEDRHTELVKEDSRSGSGWKDVKLETFEASVRLSRNHELSAAEAHLRGSSSLRDCAPNRLSYAIDLEGGRERYLFSESDKGNGSDEFYLIAMCLDPMYLNQLTAERLMQEIGVFRPAIRLVEFKVEGKTQGAYLLMENLKENLTRNHSLVKSVIRRRNSGPDVKFPSEQDTGDFGAAVDAYNDLTDGLSGLNAEERLAYLAPRLDLHRYMFFVAFQALVENGDWGDEPSFFATETLNDGSPEDFFTINGWDADDLLDGCGHSGNVIDDPNGLIGCAEHAFEKALFGGSEISDDAVYRMYVDALAVAIDYFTEERVGDAFERTASDLERFAHSPDMRSVMEDWKDESDVPAALESAVKDRIRRYAERRETLKQRLADYYAKHN